MNPYEIFALQVSIVASVVILQIKSTLPCLLGSILQLTGFRRRDPLFWPREGMSKMTRDDWTDWASSAGGNWVEVKFFYLINCGYCLNFHLSWISSVVVACIFWDPSYLIFAPSCFLISAVALRNS
jgi:hypothetical protein